MEYPVMNPLSQIMPGIQTGLAMRANRPQPVSENPMAMSDPGEFQPTKPEAVLKDVDEDLGRYEAKWQQLKEWESKTGQKITPENKKTVMLNYAKNFKSDIVKTALKSGIHPDVLSSVITDIKNGSEDVEGDLTALTLLSKDNPEMKAAIQSKFAQYGQVEEQNKQQRVQVLTKTLDRIDEYNTNPKAWIDKHGQINPQTEKIAKNWKNYMAELAQLDPDAAKARLEDLKSKRSRGTTKDYSGIKRTKEGFERKPFSASSIEAGLAANPDVIPSSAYGIEKESMGKNFMNIGEQEDKERQKKVSKLPKPSKPGQKANDKVVEAYVNAYGPQEAADALKRDQWKP